MLTSPHAAVQATLSPRRAKTVLALCIGVWSAVASGLEPEVIFDRVAPSVWLVRALDAGGRRVSIGSAVVIAPQRLVTNCHVLAHAASIQVRKGNQSFGAFLESPDPERDLCQLRVPDFTAPPVAIGTIDSLKIGQRVYAIGNPLGLELTMSDGIVSSLRKLSDEAPIIQTTAAISRGSSGGGLFDGEGRLIGITSFLLRNSQNLNFAVPADWIAEMPERSRMQIAKFRATQGSQAQEAPSTASADAAASGNTAEKILKSAELSRIFDGRHEMRVSEPRDLQRLIFYDGGNVSAVYNYSTRTGTRETSGDDHLCLRFFVGSRSTYTTFAFLNDCFTVSRISDGKYRFTSSDGKFMIIGEM